MDFIELSRNMSKVLRDLPNDFMEGLLKYEPQLVKANQNQLRKGQRADNSRITPTYTVDYNEIKRMKGSRSAPNPDLFVTGGFYKSLFIVQSNKPGQVVSGSDYVVNGFPLGNFLQRKYGETILGYQKPTIEKFAKITLKDYKKTIENGLKIN